MFLLGIDPRAEGVPHIFDFFYAPNLSLDSLAVAAERQLNVELAVQRLAGHHLPRIYLKVLRYRCRVAVSRLIHRLVGLADYIIVEVEQLFAMSSLRMTIVFAMLRMGIAPKAGRKKKRKDVDAHFTVQVKVVL